MAYGWGAADDAHVEYRADGTPYVVYTKPINTVTVTGSGPAVYQDIDGAVIPVATSGGQSSDLTGWLNNNAGTLAVGAAAFLGFVFVMKAMR